MPQPPDASPLEDLPLATGELARATLAAGRAVVCNSVAASSAAAARPLFAIRQTSLQLNFFIAKSGEEIVFFFFKKLLATIRPLEAQLKFALRARQDLPSPLAPAPTAPKSSALAPAESCRYLLLVPPFLRLHPTSDELALYAPPGTTQANGILLNTGPQGQHVLGICNPEAGSRATAIYTTRNRQALTAWPAEPFLELTETLRAWLAEAETKSQEVSLALPSEPGAMSDVHSTLFWFVEAYRSLESEQKAAAPLSPPLAAIVPSYETQDYTADIKLCVDRSGHFATPKERDPVSLTMQLAVRRELGALVARIKLGPPDFLSSGELRAAFLEKLRSSTPSATLRAIGPGEAWSDFLDSATERAVVLRTSRDRDTDTDVVVLPGTWQGSERTLILQTRAKVDVKAQPVSVVLAAVTLRYDSQASAQALLDDDTVTYFMRLATAFKDWLAVLR